MLGPLERQLLIWWQCRGYGTWLVAVSISSYWASFATNSEWITNILPLSKRYSRGVFVLPTKVTSSNIWGRFVICHWSDTRIWLILCKKSHWLWKYWTTIGWTAWLRQVLWFLDGNVTFVCGEVWYNKSQGTLIWDLCGVVDILSPYAIALLRLYSSLLLINLLVLWSLLGFIEVLGSMRGAEVKSRLTFHLPNNAFQTSAVHMSYC